jgi:hypothetical protein
VTIEVDLPQGRFALSKRWLSRAMARVTDATGRILAQDDEAEAWIASLLGSGLSGPSGLLWVRQGLLGLDSDDRAERERGLATRRDLMSSVAGEIDMMTGGRRMDGVLDRVKEALAVLATGTGKPKTGGDWARALDEAAALSAQEAVLRQKAITLGGDLLRRTQILRDQARLTDPGASKARDAALDEATVAHDAALAHAARLTDALREVKLADLTAKAAVTEISRIERLADRVQTATAAAERAAAKAATDRDRAVELAGRDVALTAAAAEAAQQTRTLRLRLSAAQKARLGLAARQRVADLTRSLTRATALQSLQQSARARRTLLKVTAQAVAQAEKAQAVSDRLGAQADAQAVTLQFTYAGPGRALRDSAPVDAAPLRLQSRTDFVLPGLGTLSVDPGAGRGGDLTAAMTEAAAVLSRHLAACEATDLAEARHHLTTAQRLDEEIRQTEIALADLAPDGVDALRQALASGMAEADMATDAAEDPGLVEPLLARAEVAEADALALSATAHRLATAAGEQRAKSEADAMSAVRQRDEARTEAGDPDDLARALAALRAALPIQQNHCAAAAATAARLQAEAPDLQTAAARLARAASASQQARHEADRLREELTGLNTRIEVLAEQGIEETLDGITGARAAAERRAGRLDAEVQSLIRLRRALDDARAQARDAYFGPVLRELEPLLAILHPDAVLQIDDATLLPVTLTRAGQPESLDILSGGTREQLAILTRLAFARLFARGGQAVPVILDDALVHSDDDRIEAMFTALHRVARDQQIIVLTCRQRAFAPLGGDRARVEVTAL